MQVHRIALALACALHASTLTAQAPWWADSLEYARSEVVPIRVASDGFPYVSVRIDTTDLWLLFDTGNMVGLTVESRWFDELALPVVETIRRRDSAGELIGAFRVGRASTVEALARTEREVSVREFRHPRLAGLFGPDDLPGSRFTLDYRHRVLAVAASPVPHVFGRAAHRLIRSARHPRLIVVEGTFRGTPILIEIDTGKSRTVVDPAWAAGAGLAVDGTDTVAVGAVRVGDAVFDVRDAKPVSLGGIDPELPAPLVMSLGSDTLARFVLTVDYTRGLVLLWHAR